MEPWIDGSWWASRLGILYPWARVGDAVRGSPELAEAIGAFALVLAGCGAIMVDSTHGGLGTFAVAAAFGLVIGAMVYATGHVSGAHFNPAVTLAFAATHHFPWRRVPSYMAAQALGATAAALVLRWALGDVADLGTTQPGAGVDAPRLIVLEVLITAILMFVIASVATDGRAMGTMAGIAIGATVGLNALWAGPLTGASMNPARTLGPALVSTTWAWLPVYLLAPTAGALLGACAYEAVRRGDRPRKEAIHA